MVANKVRSNMVGAQGLPWTSGQGTIEYLVIIAVVVVISLVVVGLTTNMVSSPSTQISSSTDKVGSLTSGGISVVESVSDSSGDSLIRLQNNSGEALTLEKISVGGNETVYGEQLVSGDAKSFSLSDLDLSCPCVEGQEKVSCSFDFYVTTQTGLAKKQTTTITTQCEQSVEAVNPARVVGLGSGTLENPWVINSCRELYNINLNLDGNYKLGADLNCSDSMYWDEELETYSTAEGYGMIGSDSTPFTGTFNGNNHTISDMFIYDTADSNMGLFAKNDGNIFGLNITNFKLTYSEDTIVEDAASYKGTIAGINNGNIFDCTISSTIQTEWFSYAGGIAGLNNGIIEDNNFLYVDIPWLLGIFTPQNIGTVAGVNNGTIQRNITYGSHEYYEGQHYWGDPEFPCFSSVVSCGDSGLTQDGITYVDNGTTLDNNFTNCLAELSMCLI